MSNTTDIAIVNGARTPMGRYCGKLRDFTAMDLGAIAATEAMKRSGIEPAEIDHVVIGNAQQTSGDSIYGARHVALKAGVPVEVPALTVNRLCGSGMQSVVTAAQMIQLGESKIALAGGMESMSQAPHVIRGMRWGVGLGEGKLEDSLMVALLDTYCGLYMANTAELYANQQGVTREMQDEFALRSQKTADDAYKAGRLQEELTPVALRNRKGEPSGEMFTEDDLRRPETTMESLRKLKPAFGTGGVTAGNASGIVDGGAAVVVMPLAEAEKRNLKPMARIVSWGIAGVDPRIMGSGPVPATRIALKKAGLKLEDIDLIEVNEAFAAQYLAVEKELGLDRNKVNVNGGAIALGHPLGATGTRLLITLMNELRRRKGGYGLSTACIGGGQGIAVIIENLQR
jgi:acetyl-CoA acetyltransferase family protein